MARRHDARGRSTGEARHVRLYHWLMSSPAWQSLSPVERCVFIEIAKRFDGKNNGYIVFSCREGAEELHVSKATVSRAIGRLATLGFIDVVVPGGFNRKARQASEFRLNHIPCQRTGELPSKRFMSWGRKTA